MQTFRSRVNRRRQPCWPRAHDREIALDLVLISGRERSQQPRDLRHLAQGRSAQRRADWCDEHRQFSVRQMKTPSERDTLLAPHIDKAMRDVILIEKII